MDFSKTQTKELATALTETLSTIVGEECAFVLAFTPIDKTSSTQFTVLACATNLSPPAALDMATDLVTELKSWEPFEGQSMTRQ